MKWLLTLTTVLLATPSLAGRADCSRNCATALKNFEKQCKETAGNDADSKAGCDMVSKKFESQCKQACASGQKPKKPTNTNSF
ncbi:MAG: hypothetical protein IAE78_31245 [Myxococcus sp.]|nr:hypothetical protein [Myxococcus sp.]